MLFDLSKQLFSDVSEFLHDNAKPTQSQLKAIIESALRRCNVVSREEFDAQANVLARTREKIEALEKKITTLEKSTISPDDSKPVND